MNINERVLSIPRFDLPAIMPELPDVGILRNPAAFDGALDRGSTLYVPRSIAEESPHLKHVATYAVVWFWYEGQRFYLSYRRRPKGHGEDSRLASLFSLGVGGHVTEDDERMRLAVERELREEVPDIFGRGLVSEPIGWINDESNPVGSVHLGLLVMAQAMPPHSLHDAERWLASSTLQEPYFCTGEHIQSHLVGRMESWSEIVFRELIRPHLKRD